LLWVCRFDASACSARQEYSRLAASSPAKINLKKVAYFRVENNTAQRTAIKHQFTTNSPHKTGFCAAIFVKIPVKTAIDRN
jgi:hypothetical protein